NWQPSELATFVRKPASAFRTNGTRFALLLLGTVSGRDQNEAGLARRALNDALMLQILEPGLHGLDGILTGRLVASPLRRLSALIHRFQRGSARLSTHSGGKCKSTSDRRSCVRNHYAQVSGSEFFSLKTIFPLSCSTPEAAHRVLDLVIIPIGRSRPM